MERFGQGFGRVLGGVWEAKILDFRFFFVIFSMQNLECNLEGQKIEKKGHKTSDCRLLGQGRRWSGASWGEKKRGVQEPDRELELDIKRIGQELWLRTIWFMV